MLELRNVSWKNKRGFEIKDLSLALESGRMFCLMGPNGSGKSTLIRLLTGELRPDSGEALLDGMRASAISRRSFAQSVAVIRQERSFIFPMTCHDLIMTGRAPYLGFMGRAGGEDERMAQYVMEKTNTLQLANASFQEISGGEKQRVMLARALMQRPKTLIMDEAVSSMDMEQAITSLRRVKRIAQEDNIAVLCVLHDIHLAYAFASEVLIMENGRIIERGRPEGVIASDNMERLTGMEIDRFGGHLSVFIPEEE